MDFRHHLFGRSRRWTFTRLNNRLNRPPSCPAAASQLRGIGVAPFPRHDGHASEISRAEKGQEPDFLDFGGLGHFDLRTASHRICPAGVQPRCRIFCRWHGDSSNGCDISAGHRLDSFHFVRRCLCSRGWDYRLDSEAMGFGFTRVFGRCRYLDSDVCKQSGIRLHRPSSEASFGAVRLMPNMRISGTVRLRNASYANFSG